MKKLSILKLNNALIAIFFFIISAFLFSCSNEGSQKPHEALNIEMANDSIQVSMQILSGQVGKFEYNNKYFAVVPKKLTDKSSDTQIDFYIIDSPSFGIEELTADNIKSGKLKLNPPKEITSLEQFQGDLGQGLGAGGVTVTARVVDAKVKNGSLIVKDLGNKTTTTCTCPCTVQFDDDKVKYSCD